MCVSPKPKNTFPGLRSFAKPPETELLTFLLWLRGGNCTQYTFCCHAACQVTQPREDTSYHQCAQSGARDEGTSSLLLNNGSSATLKTRRRSYGTPRGLPQGWIVELAGSLLQRFRPRKVQGLRTRAGKPPIWNSLLLLYVPDSCRPKGEEE